MKKTRRRALCVFAALLGALFVLSCLVGFAACGGDDDACADGHTWDTGVETTAATCTTDGVKTYTCTVCGDTKTETIAALGHEWVSGTVKAATCTEGGYTPQTCSRCDATQNVSETAALGHELVGTYTAPEGTSTTGTWTYTCSREEGAEVSSVDSTTLVASVTLIATDEASLRAAVAWSEASAPLTVKLDAAEEEEESVEGGDGGQTPTGLDADPTEEETDAPVIELSSTLTIENEITLDLNGVTLATAKDEEETAEPAGASVKAYDGNEDPVEEAATSGWTPVEQSDDGYRNDVMISVATGANLTVKDSSTTGTGKIYYDYAGSETTVTVTGQDSDGGNDGDDGGDQNTTTYAFNNSVNNGAAIEMDGGSLVVESGTIESVSVGIRAKSGEVDINGGMVLSTGYYVIWEDTGEIDVTINGGVVAGKTHGILVDGDSNFGHPQTDEDGNTKVFEDGAKTTLTVTGGTVYSGGKSAGAIRTENGSSRESAIIKITGGDIICGGALTVGEEEIFKAEDLNTRTEKIGSIFLANGTLDISGTPTIKGPTALEIQGGKVTVSGGTFVSTVDTSETEGGATPTSDGGETSETPTQSIKTDSSSSDQYTYGYALAIVPTGWFYKYYYEAQKTEASTYTTAVDVTISGGTFVGDVYVAAHNAWGYKDDNSTDPVHLGLDGKYDGSDTATQSATLSYVWTVAFERDATGNTEQPYVVVIDSSVLTLTPYDSNNQAITDQTSQGSSDPVYYLWKYVATSQGND